MKFFKPLIIVLLVAGVLTAAGWAGFARGGRLEGTLQAVNTANSTITVSGQTFTVSTNTVIEVKSGAGVTHITLAQLSAHIGASVVINFDAHGRVHFIEIKQ